MAFTVAYYHAVCRTGVLQKVEKQMEDSVGPFVSLLFCALCSDLCMPINVGEECLCKHCCFSVRFA